MPRFEKVYCSQCGGEFGPRDSGYSHCEDHRKEPVWRFDSETYCVVFCLAHSGTVQMTSNIADEATATLYADGIRSQGGHVFAILSAGTLIALIRSAEV